MRRCKIGDTIRATRPFSEYAGSMAGLHAMVIPETPAACEEARRLIDTGRWVVYRCGECELVIEECSCEQEKP